MNTTDSPLEFNLFVLWQNLAVAQRKLEGFTKGDRTLSDIGHAREALKELRDARLEITTVEIRLRNAIDGIDSETDIRLADVLNVVAEAYPDDEQPRSPWGGLDGEDSETSGSALPWADDEEAR